MNGKPKVSPEALKLILENAAWASMGIKLIDEVKPVVEEKKEEVKPIVEAKAEPVEKHVCPLCESELKAAISDERLMEHTKEMVNVLTEAEEEFDEDEDEDEVGPDEEDEDFEDEDEVEVDDDEEEE